MTNITRRTGLRLGVAALAATVTLPLVATTPASAQTTHEVRMLNAHPADRTQRMVFDPPVLRIQPGDTVRFVATDRGHNAQTVDGMLPEGAEAFRGRVNEEFEVTFTAEGTYGYVCQPHQTMGMVGFILVGDHSTNFAAVREAAAGMRGRQTQERVEGYLTEIESGIY